jgi:hypothetical protein
VFTIRIPRLVTTGFATIITDLITVALFSMKLKERKAIGVTVLAER